MNTSDSETSFVALLKEAFPDFSSLSLDCEARWAIDHNQDDLADVISAIDENDGRSAFTDRLRRSHPPGRPHLPEFDRHLWTVVTEGEAFAWAAVTAGLSGPRFTDDNGRPDLSCGGAWVEVKKVHHGDEESRFRREVILPELDRSDGVTRTTDHFVDLHATVIKKLNDGLADARTKHARQEFGGPLVVYFYVQVDFPTHRDRARQVLRDWAQSQDQVRIVVTGLSTDWRAPLVDTN